MNDTALARFGEAYAAHRASEGRGLSRDELLSLPYLRTGSLVRQWAVRARTFDAFTRDVLHPEARRLGRPLDLLDLGAGNGWLSFRAALQGHHATALDIRDDTVDGLGTAAHFPADVPGRIACVVASFDTIPRDNASADITVFNAALHYATDLAASLAEAARVTRPGGVIAILDSPFYRQDRHGAAMVAEKHQNAAVRFGNSAGALLGLPFIEYLTSMRLAQASAAIGLVWQRRPVRYPLWYELRPLVAALHRRRPPSRFDLWRARRL